MKIENIAISFEDGTVQTFEGFAKLLKANDELRSELAYARKFLDKARQEREDAELKYENLLTELKRIASLV